MTANEMIERIPAGGCVREFSADPYVSDSCGAEVSCLGCGSCSAHCGCESEVTLELLEADRKVRAGVTPLWKCIDEQDWS